MAPAIRAYVEETARAFGIDEQIRFGQRVIRADWSSAEGALDGRDRKRRAVGGCTCASCSSASGYYDYAQGYRPQWPGEADFAAGSSIRNSGPRIWTMRASTSS